MTAVVGVDGAGRTHRLHRIAAAAGGAPWWLSGSPAEVTTGLATARAEDRPVIVDDAHRLAPATLRELTAAARSGVRVIISRRPTITSPELSELDEAVAAGGVEMLSPLDVDGTAALVAEITAHPVSPETAAAVHAVSAGLPAIAAAVATALTNAPPPHGPLLDQPILHNPRPAGRSRSGPGPGGHGSGGSGLGRHVPALLGRVQRRFAVLDPGVVAVARVLALRLDLADPVLAGAAGIEVAGLSAALRSLRDEGMLAPDGDTMIPAIAAAVLADLPAAHRRRVHESVAAALTATGSDPVAAAGQLRAARACTRSAAGVYARAGERLRFTDPAAAHGWFDDAVAAGADPADVAAGHAETGALLGLPVDTDPHTAGLPDPTDLHTAGPGAGIRAAGPADRIRLVAGVVAAHQGRADRAADVLLDTPGVGPLLAVPVLVGTGRIADARVAAEISGPSALKRLAEGVLAADRPGDALPLLIEAAEAAERAAPTVVLPDTPHALGAVVAVAAGDVASAEHLLTRAGAAAVGGPVGAGRHRLLLAWARMRAGRYDTALRELRRPASDPRDARGVSNPVADGRELRDVGHPDAGGRDPRDVLRREEGGRERLLRAALAAGIARRRGDIAGLRDAWAGIEPLLARRAVDLWQVEMVEELAVAAARLRRAERVTPVLDVLDQIVSGWERPGVWAVALGWIRLHMAVAADDPAGAGDVAARLGAYDDVEARPRAQRIAAARWAEVLAGEVLPDAVLEATEELQAVQLPWEASRLAGQAAIRTGDPAAARRLLERARELSEPEPAATADSGPSTAGLSEREVTVARLVLAGSTHREIGAQLYIAPKTVEHHVARIRGKLGAGTRAELLAMLREMLGD